MKIGVDISQIVYGTGTSVYTKKLIENLFSIDGENNYTLFAGSLRRSAELSSFYAHLPNRNKHELKSYPFPPTLADLLWNKLHILPVDLFTGKVDIFHSSDWTQPPVNAMKVTTVHDLAPILFPDSTPPKVRDVHKRRLYWVKREVDAAIVPSNATKADLVAFGVSEAKIHVIPEAPHLLNVLPANVPRLIKKYQLMRPYALSVGLNPRKNVARIIEAFNMTKKKAKLKQLVIVGHGDVPANLSSKDIITTGHITDSELASLYSLASLFLYPSLHEGFGLPILDSFSFGVPVVTSNISSMPEVAEGAAVLVDPKDTGSIANGIYKALAQSNELKDKGLKQVKKFSWVDNARKTLEIYSSLAK